MIVRILSLAFSVVGLFLSSWIVIPAPTFFLLPLGVGAPEISRWLIEVNAIAFVFTLVLVKPIAWMRLSLGLSVLALGLSLIPSLQYETARKLAEATFYPISESKYVDRIPADVQQKLRPDPSSNIPVPTVRETLGVEFARPDQVSLKLNVYRPLQAGKNPAIVQIYGGAWRTGDPSANAQFSRYIAAQGYTVLAIDYRHAPQYTFPTQLEDVKTALGFIREHADEYEVNLDRVAIMGRSAGGQLATLAAYTTNIIPFRAVVSYYGPVDLTEGYNNPPFPDPIDSRAVLTAFLGGTPQDRPELYRQASPYQAVKPNLPPTLLIYGKRDHIVKSEYGYQLYKKLNQTGNTAVFIEIPWAEHAFDAVFNGMSNQFAIYYTERFLAWALLTDR